MEMAWDEIRGAANVAMDNRHQHVEIEHLTKAILEKTDGVAQRIFTKAGLDYALLLQSTDKVVSLQPKVSGETSRSPVGPHYFSLVKNAHEIQKDMRDPFLSIEHLLLSFPSDKIFGQKLFKDLQLSENALKDAVDAIRESLNDQKGTYEALEKYGNDLTELARRGKLNPISYIDLLI